ncbi:MAG: T9SS type A sorting domain-containing protein [Aureispira sp.]|nr:T9SS type A sorting domain-containing protein [Aureispira sp.]
MNIVKLLFTVTIIFTSIFSLYAQPYSNSTFDDYWIVTDLASPQYIYFQFDGVGGIDTIGIFGGAGQNNGSYQVNSNGSYSGSFTLGTDFITFSGQLHNNDSATVTLLIDNSTYGPFPCVKANPSKLGGTWQGTFIEDSTNLTYNVTLSVDAHGKYIASSGIAGPVVGELLVNNNGNVVSHFTTVDPNGGWGEIHLNGSLIAPDTIVGKLDLDCKPCHDAQLRLVRTQFLSIEKIFSPKVSLSLQAYPNPATDHVQIGFELKTPEIIDVKVYDLLGQQVASLLQEQLPAGTHNISWNINQSIIPQGQYIVRLQGTRSQSQQKIMITK